MASEDLKQIVAAEVALGASTGELAERHGYSRTGMRKLIHSPPVQALVAEERQALAERAEQYRAELVGMGETAVENVRRTIEDPSHPRNVETSRWLLDRIAFGRTDAPQTAVNVAILSPEAVAILNERLPAYAESLVGATEDDIEDSPHLFRAADRRAPR